MKRYDIEKLLDRYYNGESTEAEEQALKRFFVEEKVPDELEIDQQIFMQLQQASEVPSTMGTRLSDLIDHWEAQEQCPKEKHHFRPSIYLQRIGSIAACILLLLGVGWHLHQSRPSVRQDTYSTPEEAYVQVEKALTMFSIALNKGITQMETLQKQTQEVEKNLSKHLKKLNHSEL